jgi:hypothetical protein
MGMNTASFAGTRSDSGEIIRIQKQRDLSRAVLCQGKALAIGQQFNSGIAHRKSAIYGTNFQAF